MKMANKTKRKYKNVKVVVDGVKFDSIAESKRYPELKLLLRAGRISNLELQKPFVIIPKQEGERATKYIADFAYIENGLPVVEDVKSEATQKLPDYVMKRKLMLLVHGIRVREIGLKGQ